MPPHLRQVIDIRVGRLGEEIRGALTLAAVIGQEVPLDLWRVVAALDEEALLEVVERAVDAHVLDATRDGTRVRFVHALSREALYEGVLPPRRRIWHRQVADALIAMPAPDPDASPTISARPAIRAPGSGSSEPGIGPNAPTPGSPPSSAARRRQSSLSVCPGQERRRIQLLYRCGRLRRYSEPELAIADLVRGGAAGACRRRRGPDG